MPTYNGFSTINPLSQKKFVLNDNDLIKQDLLNILMTPQGSRVMYPTLGCVIWQKLFDTLSATDISDISANITDIVANDPRVNLLNLNIAQSGYIITITLGLQYTATSQLDTMTVNFQSTSEMQAF